MTSPVQECIKIDVITGSDHPVFHHVLKEACGNQLNDPVARLTNLGWVCFGPTLVEEFRRNSRSKYRSSLIREQPPPDDVVRKFWELESLGIKDKTGQALSPEEQAAVKHYFLRMYGTVLVFHGEMENRSWRTIIK